MRMRWLVMMLVLSAIGGGASLAQQPVRPLPRLGHCPLGYGTSGSDCLPSSDATTRGAIEKIGPSCPPGFHTSGSYCISSPGNVREAIRKIGDSCPPGWWSSGSYCLKDP
ncbi:MAG: hypothetical protein ACKOCM_02695 [Cyanobacteriota bacterium]